MEKINPNELPITAWLPTTLKESKKRGWDELDVVLITGDAYVDFAFVQTSYKSAFYPYFAANLDNPVVNSNNTIKSFTVTIGSRF